MSQEIIIRLLLYTAACFTYGITRVEGLRIAVNAEQHMTVMEGTQNVALNCPITGATLPVTYRWFHSPSNQGLNETQITASTASYKLGKSVLTITAIAKTDQGDFRAEVTDAAGGSGTCRFNLNVAYSPTFVNLPPPEISVNLSQPFVLDCQAIGNPTPTISWFKDGAVLGNRMNVIFVGSQLQFSEIELFDRGSYQCNATNQYGSVISPSTHIYIDVPLSFSSVPESVLFLNEGQNVTLECNITGFPHPIITWYKDNYFLNEDYHRTITKVYSEIFSWSHLTFSTIKYTDSGMYTCEAQNKNEVISYAAEVIVQVLPKVISHHPKGMIVHIGAPFTLDCKATGIPPPTYTWFHNGKPIATIADTHFETDRYSGLLSIKESFGTDAGEYYCQVVNDVGEINSPTTLLYIDGLHFLKRPPPTVYILEGTSKTMECEVAGSRRVLAVDWYKDDKKLIQGCQKSVDLLFKSNDCPVEIEGTTLILNSVTLDEEGTYTCVGKETDIVDPQQIRARTYVQIMVQPEFSPPLPSVIEGRRMNELTVNCTASGKPAPKTEWLKNGVHLSNDTYREVSGGVLYIRELHTRHNGKYTCVASNEAGRKVQVVRIHVNSGPAALNATISVTSRTATVSWQVRLTNGYDIHHFEMEFKESSPEHTTWTGVGENIPGEARQYTITGLKANATYQLHMWAVNKQGIGEILTKEFITLPANTEARGLQGNQLIILIAGIVVVLCLILLVICIVLTRKNSHLWIGKKEEDSRSLMNNQHDSGSHINPAFNTDTPNNQKGMELHEVNKYGSTVHAVNGTPQEVVDTTA